jgi:hypothetical protein
VATSSVAQGPLSVSIPYWLGSKLRGLNGWAGCPMCGFQSPIGWGLSCEAWPARRRIDPDATVSIPYWLGSKLRGGNEPVLRGWETVSIPYWLGSKLRGRKCHGGLSVENNLHARFNPLLVGV